MRGTCTVDAGALLTTTQNCFEGLGLPHDDARTVAEVLVDANVRGVPSHGFQRVPAYMRKVHAGMAGGTEAMRVVAEHGGLCRFDAGHALGPAAAVKALRHGVGLARRFGVSLVAVGGSSHFGCAGYYARMAAHAGQVAVVMTNSVKRMAPYGAAAPFLGTNPVAVGIPLPGRDPFVLDLSTSAEAGGKIMRAKERGEPIPPGVALDSEGRPTIDPAEALAGSLLPIAGAKGSGLALAVSLMAVLLAGAESDDVLAPMHGDLGRPQNVGHVFILADVEKIAAPDGDQRVGEMVERLHRLPPVPGGRAVRYPGEGATARLDTVSLDIAELEAAAATCRECGLDALGDEVLRLGQLPVAGEAACG